MFLLACGSGVYQLIYIAILFERAFSIKIYWFLTNIFSKFQVCIILGLGLFIKGTGTFRYLNILFNGVEHYIFVYWYFFNGFLEILFIVDLADYGNNMVMTNNNNCVWFAGLLAEHSAVPPECLIVNLFDCTNLSSKVGYSVFFSLV